MARNTPRSFAKRLRAFANDIPKQQNEIKKNVAQEVANNIIGDTPILTGRARGNWYPGIGAPDRTSVSQGGFSATGSGSLNSYTRVAAAIKRLKPGDDFYISNNLDYIELLNQGYSRKAPAGFVEDAVRKGQELIGRQVIRFK